MFLCLLRHEHSEDNLRFTRLNNFANDSKKIPETYKVPFWQFIFLHINFVSFFRLIIISGPKTSLTHANTLGFLNIVTTTEVILLAR